MVAAVQAQQPEIALFALLETLPLAGVTSAIGDATTSEGWLVSRAGMGTPVEEWGGVRSGLPSNRSGQFLEAVGDPRPTPQHIHAASHSKAVLCVVEDTRESGPPRVPGKWPFEILTGIASMLYPMSI